MGLLKFFSSIGTVGVTALNAAIAFTGVVKSGLMPENLEIGGRDQIDAVILDIAARSQHYKPQAEAKKSAILNELQAGEHRSLVVYCCICLKHESDAREIHPKTWVVWLEVIDEKLIKRKVPKELRYGYGVPDLESLIIKFMKGYSHFNSS